MDRIKNLISKADFFNSTSLLRVKGEPEHNTLMGGLISITIVISLIVTFNNKIKGTLDKGLISSTSSTINSDNPLSFNLTNNGSDHFMFGVEVWHHDLNKKNRYFDVVLTNTIYKYGEPQNTSISYPLEACNESHWANYPKIQAQFTSLNMSYWKCLPKNLSLEIKGKYSSNESMTLNVALMKCTDKSDDPCAPQSEID
jgi:hypothetical protein